MITDIVSRKPAVSHWPTLASTFRSTSSTGSATVMIVSFRITTNVDTSSTPMTVRSRALMVPAGFGAGCPGLSWVLAVTVFPSLDVGCTLGGRTDRTPPVNRCTPDFPAHLAVSSATGSRDPAVRQGQHHRPALLFRGLDTGDGHRED